MDEQKIIQALSQVEHPEIKNTLVEMTLQERQSFFRMEQRNWRG